MSASLTPMVPELAVGHVDAADRQADVVNDAIEFVGRDGLPDRLLDLIAELGGLLDPGADLSAQMQFDLATVDRREEVLTQERHQR